MSGNFRTIFCNRHINMSPAKRATERARLGGQTVPSHATRTSSVIRVPGSSEQEVLQSGIKCLMKHVGTAL